MWQMDLIIDIQYLKFVLGLSVEFSCSGLDLRQVKGETVLPGSFSLCFIVPSEKLIWLAGVCSGTVREMMENVERRQEWQKNFSCLLQWEALKGLGSISKDNHSSHGWENLGLTWYRFTLSECLVLLYLLKMRSTNPPTKGRGWKFPTCGLP